MSDISSLIEVYRMNEIAPVTRANVIVKLGEAINNALGGNITEPLVFELINLMIGESDYTPEVKRFMAHYSNLNVPGDR